MISALVDIYLTVIYTLVIMSDKTTVLNVKIDKQLKKQAQEVAKALGLPVSTLVASSLRDVVRRRSITISDEPHIRPDVERELLRMSKAAREGKDVSPVFTDTDSALDWLRSED